ncbi:MAG: hypothetical protein E7075_04105 [Bacteroidales bacterium]|nr:hypothetical protein [Bacteroidales bacterium]
MSKIDLSKADVGDYFIRQDHVVVQFTGVVKEINGVKYYKMRVGDYTHSYKQDGSIDALDMPDSFYKEKHLIRQVSESEVEMIKHAEDIERKRRQEVIALAEKLVINEEMMKAHRGLFEAEVHARTKAPTSYSAFVIRSAEEFVKYKERYLNTGNV